MSYIFSRIIFRYLPAVTVPIAAVIGFIGYNFESRFSKSFNPPFPESVQNKRTERLVDELSTTSTENVEDISLKSKKFVPKTIFEKNVSPSLQDE